MLSPTISRIVRCSVRVPNKIYRYEESIFPIMAAILKRIGDDSFPIDILCEEICGGRWNINDFIEALDALFALNSIKLDYDKGTISKC